MAVGDIWTVRIVTFNVDQLGINVLHYKTIAEAGVGATAQDVAGAVSGATHAAYKALMGNAATFRGVGARKIFPIPTLEAVTVANLGAGTAGAFMGPAQTSGLISQRSAVPGRRGRGRTYVPFPAQADIGTAGKPIPAYTTRLGTLATAMLGPIVAGVGGNTSTISLTIFHKATSTSDNVNSQIPATEFATQRRRGGMGRKNVVPF